MSNTNQSGMSRAELVEARKQITRQIKALKKYSKSQAVLQEIAEKEDALEQIRIELCLGKFSIAQQAGICH